MKQITLKIDNNQYESLKILCKQYNIKNVSWFIRRSIDIYLEINRKEGNI